MKRKMISLFVIVLFLCLCSCGNTVSKDDYDSLLSKYDKLYEQVNGETTTEVTNLQASDSNNFVVNQTVYDGGFISLFCERISHDGVYFEILNKSSVSIDVSFYSIGLDGSEYDLHNENWGVCTIEPSQRSKYRMVGSIQTVEHQTISIYGVVYVNNTGEENIDVCDFRLGGKKNIVESKPVKATLIDNEYWKIDFVEKKESGLQFKALNKSDIGKDLSVETITINGRTYDVISGGGTNPAPHTASCFTVNLHDLDETLAVEKITSFSANMRVWRGGEGTISEFNMSYKF